MELAAPSFFAGHEARADPYRLRALCQRTGKPSAIVDASRRHHYRRLARQRALVPLRHIENRGRENHRRDLITVSHLHCHPSEQSAYRSRVTTTLRSLRANDIHARVQRLDRMLRRTHHIHDQNASRMQAVDDVLRRHAHGGHKQPRAILDGDVNQLVEVAVGVVVVGLAGAAADLRQREVDAEGQRWVVQVRLDLVDDLLQLRRRVPQPADHAQAARVGHRGREGPARCACHAREDDRVLDAEELAEGGAERGWHGGGGVVLWWVW